MTTDLGPRAHWPDLRALDLVLGYAWSDHQRAVLVGREPWRSAGPGLHQRQAFENIEACLHERGYVVDLSPDGAVVSVTLPGLPAHDSNAAALAEQWGLSFHRIRLLTLEGPVERTRALAVPIFRGTIFGSIEGRNCAAVHGLSHDVFIVGRLDVREVLRVRRWLDVAGPRWEEKPGDVIETERGHVRTTLRRARNTAARVEDAIPAWNTYVRARDRAAEAERLAAEAARDLEPVDEDLLAFRP